MSVTRAQLAEAFAQQFDYERLADKIAERLERPVGERVSARELADRYGHTARYFRDRKALFGARPVGDGPRPRLEFDTAYVERVLADRRIS